MTTFFSAYRFLKFHGPIKFVSTAFRVLMEKAQAFALKRKFGYEEQTESSNSTIAASPSQNCPTPQ